MPFLIMCVVLIFLIVMRGIKVVPQTQAYIVERFGVYRKTWSEGLHFKTPIIDKVIRKINLKEQVAAFPPQPVITKDNVAMRIDTVVFYQITDPKLYVYSVENPLMAIEEHTVTILRDVISDMEMEQTLSSRETINNKMRSKLAISIEHWGIKVNQVKVKNIIPPAEIQNAMEKKCKAVIAAQEAAEIEKIRRQAMQN